MWAISWSKEKGWLVHKDKLDAQEIIVPSKKLALIGKVVLVRSIDKAWVECEEYKILGDRSVDTDDLDDV